MRHYLDKLLQFRIVRFGLTGGMAACIHISIAFLFLHFIADNVFIANLSGFGCAFIFSYIAQSLIVFKSPIALKNALRFFAVQFSALLLSQLLSELFADINSYIRIVVIVFIIPMITYLIHRVWTFSHSNKPDYSAD